MYHILLVLKGDDEATPRYDRVLGGLGAIVLLKAYLGQGYYFIIDVDLRCCSNAQMKMLNLILGR